MALFFLVLNAAFAFALASFLARDRRLAPRLFSRLSLLQISVDFIHIHPGLKGSFPSFQSDGETQRRREDTYPFCLAHVGKYNNATITLVRARAALLSLSDCFPHFHDCVVCGKKRLEKYYMLQRYRLDRVPCKANYQNDPIYRHGRYFRHRTAER